MREIRVHYRNGDSVMTKISGSIERIVQYYFESRFTFMNDNGTEYHVEANSITFLDPTTFQMGDAQIRVHEIYLHGRFPVTVRYTSFRPGNEPETTICAYRPGMFGWF